MELVMHISSTNQPRIASYTVGVHLVEYPLNGLCDAITTLQQKKIYFYEKLSFKHSKHRKKARMMFFFIFKNRKLAKDYFCLYQVDYGTLSVV